MDGTFEQASLRCDILEALRKKAAEGSTPSDLINVIQTCGYNRKTDHAMFLYFMKALNIPLREALPLRELIGSDETEKIDQILLPAIERFLRSRSAE